MTCLFCQIVEGGRQASTVYANHMAVGFLDHRPLFPGHVLLVPRAHVSTLAELPKPAVGAFFHTVQLLARAVEAAMEAEGSFIAINNRVSQSVPHLHVHVVPRNKGDGLRGFFWPRNPYRDGEHQAVVAEAIREQMVFLTDPGTNE